MASAFIFTGGNSVNLLFRQSARREKERKLKCLLLLLSKNVCHVCENYLTSLKENQTVAPEQLKSKNKLLPQHNLKTLESLYLEVPVCTLKEFL